MIDAPCPGCGCTAADSVHHIVGALLQDDVDRALDLGLLQHEPCVRCGDACRARLCAAREARRIALEARERHRARNARLARRDAERAARRSAAATQPAALPPAAAAALARARARASKS